MYGNDRLFVYERLETAPSAVQDAAVAALEKAGHPVVTVRVQSPYDLGQEFFRWEIATAVVGSILGINPFDQPDVEAAKIAAKKLTSEYEATGKLAEETPIHTESGCRCSPTRSTRRNSRRTARRCGTFWPRTWGRSARGITSRSMPTSR